MFYRDDIKTLNYCNNNCCAPSMIPSMREPIARNSAQYECKKQCNVIISFVRFGWKFLQDDCENGDRECLR